MIGDHRTLSICDCRLHMFHMIFGALCLLSSWNHMIHKKYHVSKCDRVSSSVNNLWKMTTKILLRDMHVFLECHHGSISFLQEVKTHIPSIRRFSDKGHYVSSWNSALSQIRKDVNLLVANMELQLKMEWAVSIVKLHEISVSYSIWSSRTCMSKQGALSIRKKRIGERTTSSGIHYWMKNMSYVKIGKSKEHRTEAKIWSTLLSRFRWYVWISTDQLMSCLQQSQISFCDDHWLL